MNNTVSVNLLPDDILAQKKPVTKASTFSKFSIIILVILIVVTTATLGLRYVQNNQKKAAEVRLSSAETELIAHQTKEVKLVSLKTQLSALKSYLNLDEKKRTAFNKLVDIAPEGVIFSAISMDKNGNLTLQFTASDLSTIDRYINEIGSIGTADGLLKRIDLDSISFSNEAGYDISMRLILK